MPSLDSLAQLAHQPLVRLAGGPITPGSLLTGIFIVLSANVLAGLLDRAIDRVLSQRQVAHGARFAIAKIARYCVSCWA
jgi:small-conductance mechanosensitive channel